MIRQFLQTISDRWSELLKPVTEWIDEVLILAGMLAWSAGMWIPVEFGWLSTSRLIHG